LLVVASPMAFGALKVVGAFYLLWLAWSTLRHGSALKLDGPGAATGLRSARSSFLTGLGVNLANPKVVIFFITFLPSFVSADDPHASGKLLFLGLWFVALNLVLATALVLAASQVVEALRRSPRVLRVVDWIFAGVFGLFAVAILRAQARS
jgi:threonine/homoserine/homoserine lactone efflux protein